MQNNINLFPFIAFNTLADRKPGGFREKLVQNSGKKKEGKKDAFLSSKSQDLHISPLEKQL